MQVICQKKAEGIKTYEVLMTVGVRIDPSPQVTIYDRKNAKNSQKN
jgi:hypothetical protein